MSLHALHGVLTSEGYKLVEDAWSTQRRLTYIHDDDADRQHIVNLTGVMQASGWARSQHQLRTFSHQSTDEMVELEPGGADTRGHFLHIIGTRVR